MYELNRARLVGIGPRGARYNDVTIDLSGVGDPVPPASLFDQPARRPAPSSLLLLENGGGKSVLLKLLFSVVLPGRRNTVGGASLDSFVLAGDTGHVAIEWMHVATGARLVTAKVYQRRARSSDKNPVAEAWYSFRPSSLLNLDALPVVADDRRRRMDGFREAVEDADRQEPTTELAWLGDDQGRWRAHLRERGIEPDLFDIQRRMNVDEGEAAKAFKYASSKDFIDWLLRIVTDPKDATAVAETFGQWAANLADREQMILERDWLEGVIAGLEPLAEAHTAHQAAAMAATAAIKHVGALAAALEQRHRSDQEELDQLNQQHETAQALVSSRNTERDNARALANEVQLQTLGLELVEAKDREQLTRGQLKQTDLELHGWLTVPALAELDYAVATADGLADQVSAADQTAAPALRRRDEAAGRLLAKYLAEAAASDAQAASHDEQIVVARKVAARADEDRTEALGQAATARERLRAAREQVTIATERLVAASASGLVAPGTTPGHVHELAEDARAFHAEKEGRLTDAKTAVGQSAATVEEARTGLAVAEQALHRAKSAAENAGRDLKTVEEEASRLTGLPTIAAVTGDGPVDNRLTIDGLDEAAERLLAQLSQDIADHTEHLDGLRAAQREDARIVGALGTGGLLPPRPDVGRALDVLTAAGISAHAGWRYLNETAAADERAQLISAHPELADGLVLIDATQLPHARRVLDEAQLLPAAAVAVGSGASLLTLPPADDTDAPAGFVVEPTPALYDESAAEVRKAELAEQLDRRGAQLQDTVDQLASVTETHSDLHRWCQGSPKGHLTKLRETAATTQAAQDAAAAAVEIAQDAITASGDALEAAEAAAENAEVAERQAAERAAKLESLAVLVEAAAHAQHDLPEYENAFLAHETAAADALARRRTAEGDQNRHTTLAEQARGQAERHRAACADVPSTNGTAADAVPDEALSDLRAAAMAAHQTYLAVATDQDLRRRAEEAADKVQALRTALRQRDQAHVAEATRLRATPAGADRASWSIEAGNARNRVGHLGRSVEGLVKRIGQLEQAIENASPNSPAEPNRRHWVSLPAVWQPTDPEHGQALWRRAQGHVRDAQTRLDDATAVATGLMRRCQAADQAVRGINEALLPLNALLEPQPDGGSVTAYSGDVAAAKSASAAAVVRLRETRDLAESSRTELDKAAQELLKYAAQSRYEALNTLARRSILDSSVETLGAKAEGWSTALRGRLATLTSDLETLNRHRKVIVEGLAALVVQSIKTLELAVKLSKLPRDLAEWSGKPFLSITFHRPDATAISIHTGEVIDRVAAEYAERGSAGKSRNARRDGLSLLLDAIHASVPKGFAVTVLKPDTVLRDERVTIEEMNDVFSGGQELTAAIVMYCTLAALSANDRGQMRSRHSGILFLDNPIGRANASYLIDIQQAVARSLGVQLIYTTGIYDDRVLAAFPLWVRLRNDADLRAGLKYIQVADVIRANVPPPYSSAELNPAADGDTSAPGTVTAARIFQKPRRARADAEPEP